MESTLTRLEQYQVAYTNVIGWLECAEDVQTQWSALPLNAQIVMENYQDYKVYCLCEFLED